MKKKKVLNYAKQIADLENILQSTEEAQIKYETEQKMFKLMEKIFAEDPTALAEVEENVSLFLTK